MTMTGNFTLSALMDRYEQSVVFAESVPNSLKIAKTFCEMRWSNGGIVLFGVEKNGHVIGVNERSIPEIYERFKRLCLVLTKTRVEIGTLTHGPLHVVFLVFNPVPRNTKPINEYHPLIHDVVYS